MKSRVCSLALLFVFLAGCNLPNAIPAAGTGAPRAWIDAPLDGSVQPLGPLDVVAHAADPGGIGQFEFMIDGALVARHPGDVSGSGIVTAHQAWTPAAPGTYTLQVRAQNAGGAWSSPAEAVFTIGAVDTATPAVTDTASPQPAATDTPASTSTPSPSPSPSLTPSPTAAAIAFSVVPGLPTVFYHSKSCGANDPNCQSACSPGLLDMRVQVSPPELVNSVVLFFSLAGKKSTTPWNEGVSMKPLGGGLYEYKLAADSVPGAKSFDEATFRYQFVATDAKNATLARSQVFADIGLAVCP